MRSGIGYDIHRLEPGLPLILGGVVVPYPFGLIGHSDADVLLHALCDALLGSLSLGDIGTHFPDTDPQWKGISSLSLLQSCYAMVSKKQYYLINADMTVICEKPKLTPYIKEMRNKIASILNVELGCISIKATTHEKIGPIGKGKGIACQAIVTVKTNI